MMKIAVEKNCKRLSLVHLCNMERILKICREYRAMPKGYYHLCTDGWKEGVLFESDAQYVAGITSIALMTLNFNVEIYGYVLMLLPFHQPNWPFA